MRTLIYKRTHTGDPDPEGRFGIHGCMGRVRTWGFEAVIGIGGIGPEPERNELARKVNWIGIGPRRTGAIDKRGFPVIAFEHFKLLESDGRELRELAPRLTDRIYSKNVRVIMDDLDEQERAEVERVLDLARDAPPSTGAGSAPATVSEKCPLRRKPPKPIRGCSR